MKTHVYLKLETNKATTLSFPIEHVNSIKPYDDFTVVAWINNPIETSPRSYLSTKVTFEIITTVN